MIVGFYTYTNLKHNIDVNRIPVTKYAAKALDLREKNGEIWITKREGLPAGKTGKNI